MRKELGDWRWMLFAVTLHGVIALAITALIYHGGRMLIFS
jgi:Fe2+ transport system protein B